MTIRVYPSRLEGEPLETHSINEWQTIEQWLVFATKGQYKRDATDRHPTVILNGKKVEQTEWALTYFSADDALDIYIEPRGEIAAAVWWGIAYVVALVVAIVVMRSAKAGTAAQRSNKTLDDPSALANQVRWGDPIPEIAGSPITYPDYILPPRRYYIDKTQQWVDSLVCIGVGDYQTDITQMWVGDTSVPTFGDNVEIVVFQPDEEIPAELSEWWHTPEEVGFTSLGGAGMTLGPVTSIPSTWPTTLTFSGQSITGATEPPESWVAGISLRVEASHPLTFSGNSVQSALLDTLSISIGTIIELTGDREGEYTITGITAASAGSAGSAAKVTGSAAPASYDFSAISATLDITMRGTYTVLLSTNTTNLAGLVSAINAQLNGAPFRARIESGALELYQLEPYGGESFTLSGDISALFNSELYTTGAAPSSTSGKKYIAAGAEFGIGTEIASAGLRGLLYTITSITDNEVQVTPPNTVFWSGFPSSVSDARSSVELNSGSVEGGWIGPFAACPPSELSDAFEVDIFFPQGLVRYNSKGKIKAHSTSGVIEWRKIGDPDWESLPFINTGTSGDQMGVTYRIEHDSAKMEVRVKADRAPSTKSGESETQQWAGLRSRIIGAPTRYAGLTLAHVRLRSGDKVSGGVENKFSVRAKRILPTVDDPYVSEPTRDIAPFLIHMMSTVGYGRELLDMNTISALHQIWSEREDTFDLAVNANSTLKSVANSCLAAGYAELTLRNGKISAVRDAYRIGTPSRIYSPQELRAGAELIESTQTIMPDDIDGVDIEYVDYATGRTVTEQYRLPGDEGNRAEVIKAVGVTDRTRAWRIAARRRRIAAYRRTAYKCGTEMAAMNSYYMDYVGLQDGIPEYGQSAFVLAVNGLTLTLSEPIQMPVGGAIAMLRRQDGTATAPISIAAISGHDVTLTEIPTDVNITADPNHATVIYIGSRKKIMHEALITEIRPAADGRVEVQAVNMDNRVYDDDDNTPNQITITSRPYAIEQLDAAGGVFDVGVDLIAPPAGTSVAGLAGITFKASLLDSVKYTDYVHPIPEAAGLSEITFKASLIKTVDYLDYRHPEPEAAGLTSMTMKATLKRQVIDAAVPPESAAGVFNVGVVLA